MKSCTVQKFFILTLPILFLNTAFSKPEPISAKRLQNENWKIAAKRNLKNTKIESGSAFDVAKPLSEISSKDFIDFGKDRNSWKTLFKQIRDIRFYKDANAPYALRRLSWLYPDDGCFMRAEWMTELTNNNFNQKWLNKIFVFGDLKVKTPNNPSGSVSWWYHVVMGAVVNGEPAVIDPAIDPVKPLLLTQWLATMGDPATFKIAVCKHAPVGPGDLCESETLVSQKDLYQYTDSYLGAEKDRLIEMKRNPDEELGAHPPWLKAPKL